MPDGIYTIKNHLVSYWVNVADGIVVDAAPLGKRFLGYKIDGVQSIASVWGCTTELRNASKG